MCRPSDRPIDTRVSPFRAWLFPFPDPRRGVVVAAAHCCVISSLLIRSKPLKLPDGYDSHDGEPQYWSGVNSSRLHPNGGSASSALRFGSGVPRCARPTASNNGESRITQSEVLASTAIPAADGADVRLAILPPPAQCNHNYR